MKNNLLDFKTVHIIGGDDQVKELFRLMGARTYVGLDDADIVVWTGGADVDPSLYNERKHPRTCINPRRDQFETACFQRAKQKFKIGICRGGQFLNVMNGGTLWQHVDRHAIAGEHEATYVEVGRGKGFLSEKYSVTSTHHQQMIPLMKANAQVWVHAGICTRKESGNLLANSKNFAFDPLPGHSCDAEVIYYPVSRSLCFQPHPEYNSSSTKALFTRCITRMFNACAV